MNVKHELQTIISGIGNHATKNLISTAAHHLRKSKEASGNTEKSKLTKEKETEKLINGSMITSFGLSATMNPDSLPVVLNKGFT
jgi:hypothetical protein